MKFFLVFLFLSITWWVNGGNYNPKSKGELVEHAFYTLSYDEVHEQAEWVYYVLTPSNITGMVARTNDFRADPDVSTQSAQLVDYRGSGYDRGHLAPAGSMKKCPQSMSESFFLSNMSPQIPSFNRGVWKRLESVVRGWATNKGRLCVVSGPVFKNNLGEIGPNHVTIPGYFYKVIYSPRGDEMIAFLMPNGKGTKDLMEYVVPVDSVERLTGIDFFWELEDRREEHLEAEVELKGWMFNNHNAAASIQKTSAVQCKGVVKSTGLRCRNRTTHPSGYCRLHRSQALKTLSHNVQTSGVKPPDVVVKSVVN